MKKFIRENWTEILNYIAWCLSFSLVGYIGYQFLSSSVYMLHYWLLIPLVLYFLLIIYQVFFNYKNPSRRFLAIVSLISMIVLFLITNISYTELWLSEKFEVIAFIVIIIFFLNIIFVKESETSSKLSGKADLTQTLFNLFYINIPKVHEIEMLIDNRIKKTIENEEMLEKIHEHSNSFDIGKSKKISAGLGYSKKDSTKKRISENFNVEITKSTMLRKIYEKAYEVKLDEEVSKDIELGDLVIFKNIELQQQNVDDAIMLLSIFQDSKIQNQGNEKIEVNLNEMMEKILDDFTVDYTFTTQKDTADEKQYIIQLPYKSIENFVSGYRHNDLQLGKLNLIGIYRGNIDFSEKDSTTSKFLELMAESFNDNTKRNTNPIMKTSNSIKEQSDIPFEFNYKKLEDKLHLIDVIAIVQELNLKNEEEV